ncbi:hypothetical protein F5B17DRAFT_389140 [Nemania serpens]|nr:hypothetical protein F5B17DRAFT_389140 [Nemania serpens]
MSSFLHRLCPKTGRLAAPAVMLYGLGVAAPLGCRRGAYTAAATPDVSLSMRSMSRHMNTVPRTGYILIYGRQGIGSGSVKART